MFRSLSLLFVLIVLAQLPSAAGASRPSGWNDDTHGPDATPDYARVFAADRVNRMDIAITAANWAALMADMTDMAGPFGAQRVQAGPGNGFGGFAQPTDEAVAACNGKLVADTCSFGTVTGGRCIQQGNANVLACVAVGGGPGGGGGAGGNIGGGGGGNNARAQGADDVDIFPRTPMYVPSNVTFDGETFRNVGFRLKGNSSLSNAWRAGVEKLPFRLNIDVLEDQYPEITDQTFFGFPNLAFTNNGTDTSFLRQRVVTDLFRQAGVAAPQTAFIRVFIDHGDGPAYLGLYTMTEVPDKPMLDSLFASDDGNLYKPVGSGGRWTQFFQLSFPKKTNADDEDWTDVQGAIEALNDSRANAAVWRARLEARFEVNGFLRWLALNTMIGNFDTYGGLSAHNYYLYGSPRHRDRLFWIAWDHDLAMSATGIGGGGNFGGGNPGGGNPGVPPGGNPGGGNPGAGGQGALDLFQANTNANWPLIRFLLDDPVYRAAYRGHVEDLLTGVFEPGRLAARLRSEQALIAPYVVGAGGEVAGRTFLTSPAQFDTSVTTLVDYTQTRATAIRQALASTR